MASWWESVIDTVVDVGGDLYDGASQVIGDQYENYQKTVNSDNAKNVENLKQNEPLKGTAVDGSTTVAVTSAGTQNGAPAITNQIIAGVDNRLLIAGGLIAVLFLMKK
jgi:hypothetical protein